jgi:hypothetical protein
MLIESTNKTGMMNISKALTIRNYNNHKRPFANYKKKYMAQNYMQKIEAMLTLELTLLLRQFINSTIS